MSAYILCFQNAVYHILKRNIKLTGLAWNNQVRIHKILYFFTLLAFTIVNSNKPRGTWFHYSLEFMDNG